MAIPAPLAAEASELDNLLANGYSLVVYGPSATALHYHFSRLKVRARDGPLSPVLLSRFPELRQPAAAAAVLRTRGPVRVLQFRNSLRLLASMMSDALSYEPELGATTAIVASSRRESCSSAGAPADTEGHQLSYSDIQWVVFINADLVEENTVPNVTSLIQRYGCLERKITQATLKVVYHRCPLIYGLLDAISRGDEKAFTHISQILPQCKFGASHLAQSVLLEASGSNAALSNRLSVESAQVAAVHRGQLLVDCNPIVRSTTLTDGPWSDTFVLEHTAEKVKCSRHAPQPSIWSTHNGEHLVPPAQYASGNSSDTPTVKLPWNSRALVLSGSSYDKFAIDGFSLAEKNLSDILASSGVGYVWFLWHERDISDHLKVGLRFRKSFTAPQSVDVERIKKFFTDARTAGWLLVAQMRTDPVDPLPPFVPPQPLVLFDGAQVCVSGWQPGVVTNFLPCSPPDDATCRGPSRRVLLGPVKWGNVPTVTVRVGPNEALCVPPMPLTFKNTHRFQFETTALPLSICYAVYPSHHLFWDLDVSRVKFVLNTQSFVGKPGALRSVLASMLRASQVHVVNPHMWDMVTKNFRRPVTPPCTLQA